MSVPRSAFLTLPLLAVFALGCAGTQKNPPVSSQKSSKPSRLFGNRDVRPEGNSVLHYIDSRLYSLRESEDRSIDALRQSVESDPDSSFLRGELARSLAEQNQFEQATLEADKALQLEPGSPANHLLRGKLFSVKRLGEEAVQEYQNCIQIDPKMEECYTMLAREQLVAQKHQEALRTIQRLLKKVPRSSAGLYYQGTIYNSYLKDDKKAARSYQKILEEDPEDVRSIAALAQIHMDDKNYAEALKYLLQIERLAPNDIPMKLRVGLLYYELKEYDRAIERFTQALQLSPDNDRVSYYLGLLEAQRKNYDQALTYFRAVPADSELYKDAIVRAVLVMREKKEVPKAISFAQESLKKRPDIPELYEVLGTLYGKEQKFDEALRVLDKGLKKFPGQEKLLFSRGVLLDKAGRFDESVETMREILLANPKNASALNYIGYSYADRGIKLDEALDMVTQAHQLRPDDGYITDSLAWVYFKMGNREKALELLKKANSLSPNEPVILEHLGDVYLDKGETEKAKIFFREAVAAAVKQESSVDQDLKDLERIQAKLGKLNP